MSVAIVCTTMSYHAVKFTEQSPFSAKPPLVYLLSPLFFLVCLRLLCYPRAALTLTSSCVKTYQRVRGAVHLSQVQAQVHLFIL